MWRAMMQSSFEAPAAIPIAREPERMEHLIKCNKLLEEVTGPPLKAGLALSAERDDGAASACSSCWADSALLRMAQSKQATG